MHGNDKTLRNLSKCRKYCPKKIHGKIGYSNIHIFPPRGHLGHPKWGMKFMDELYHAIDEFI